MHPLLNSLMTLWQEVPPFVLSASFGTNAIRLGLFQREGLSWRLVQAGAVQAAADSEAIHDFLKRFPLSVSPLVVASWRAEMIEKPVVLPHMPGSEVRAAIKFAMEHHFSIHMDECLYDWVESTEVRPAHGMNSHQHFVYAALRKDAGVYMETLESVGEVGAIVPYSFALSKALSAQHADDQKDMAVLEIDWDSSNFQIFRKDRPLLSRAIGLGYRILGLEAAPAAGQGPPASSSEAAEEDEIQRLRPHIEKLQHSIQASVDFYHQQSFGGDVGQLFLCENGGQVRELDRYLELGLDMPVSRPSPAHFDGFEVAPVADAELQKEFTAYVPMLGTFLSWKEAGPNLLPAEVVFRNRIRSKTKLLRMAAIFAAVIGIIFNIHALILIGVKRQELETLKSRSQTAQEFQAFNSKFLEGRKFEKEATKGALPAVAFMKFLSQAVPESCVLLDLDYDKGRRRVDILALVAGNARDNAVASSAEFVAALTRSPFFEKVDLTEGVRDAASGEYRFGITAITHDS